MQSIESRKIRKQFLKNGKKILGFALDGLYYFEDDEIENLIDLAEIKLAIKGRAAIRSWIFSHERIRNKICEIGSDIYGAS